MLLMLTQGLYVFTHVYVFNKRGVEHVYVRLPLQEIAKRKLPDTNATKLESACKMVEGTARSLGLVVVD